MSEEYKWKTITPENFKAGCVDTKSLANSSVEKLGGLISEIPKDVLPFISFERVPVSYTITDENRANIQINLQSVRDAYPELKEKMDYIFTDNTDTYGDISRLDPASRVRLAYFSQNSLENRHVKNYIFDNDSDETIVNCINWGVEVNKGKIDEDIFQLFFLHQDRFDKESMIYSYIVSNIANILNTKYYATPDDAENIKIYENFMAENDARINWRGISMTASEPFVLKHSESIDWIAASRNVALPFDLFVKNRDKVDWSVVTKRISEDEVLLVHYITFIDFSEINYSEMSSGFLVMHSNRVDWDKMVRDTCTWEELNCKEVLCRHEEGCFENKWSLRYSNPTVNLMTEFNEAMERMAESGDYTHAN